MFGERQLMLSLYPQMNSFVFGYYIFTLLPNIFILLKAEPVAFEVKFGEDEVPSLIIPKDLSWFGQEDCKCCDFTKLKL